MKRTFWKKITWFILTIFRLIGFDPKAIFSTLRGLPFYLSDLSKIKKQKGQDSSFPLGRKYPILHEKFSDAGTISGAYFHQDLFVARLLFKNNPKRHVDIGSRIAGFIAHVAVFREIEVFDIRELDSKVKNISFKRADLMQLPEEMVDYCDSISALHSIEHFGLGRYGDPIDYFGHVKAIENIHRILQTGGKFYFSVPIGSQRIEFNAHRVFSIQYLLDLFDGKFTLDSFSYVDDKGDLFENVTLTQTEIERNFNCNLGCGIFELTK